MNRYSSRFARSSADSDVIIDSRSSQATLQESWQWFHFSVVAQRRHCFELLGISRGNYTRRTISEGDHCPAFVNAAELPAVANQGRTIVFQSASRGPAAGSPSFGHARGFGDDY